MKKKGGIECAFFAGGTNVIKTLLETVMYIWLFNLNWIGSPNCRKLQIFSNLAHYN